MNVFDIVGTPIEFWGGECGNMRISVNIIMILLVNLPAGGAHAQRI